MLGSVDREDVRLHQPRCHNASAFGLRGYVDTLSPLVAMHLLDRSCVIVGKFFEIQRSPTVASEPGLYVDVICTSRTQVSCGRYKSYCLPACHTLIRRYCWMKQLRPNYAYAYARLVLPTCFAHRWLVGVSFSNFS